MLRFRLCSKHSKIRILQRDGSLLASDWRIHPFPLCVCGASPMGSDSKIQKTTPTDLHLETSIRLMRNVWDIISHKIPEDMRKTLDHNIRPNGFVRSHDVSRSLLSWQSMIAYSAKLTGKTQEQQKVCLRWMWLHTEPGDIMLSRKHS